MNAGKRTVLECMVVHIQAVSRMCRLGVWPLNVEVFVCNVFNVCLFIDFEGRKQVHRGSTTQLLGRVNWVLEMLIKTWRWMSDLLKQCHRAEKAHSSPALSTKSRIPSIYVILKF